MTALWFLVSLAVVSAAPQFDSFEHNEHRHFRRPSHQRDSMEEFFKGEIFDTRRFWTEIAEEMQKIDQVLTQFYAHFPTTTSESDIKGNEYVITLTLNGFEENDIKVKAREGVVLVQAVHRSEEGNQRSYIDIKTLPSYVNVNGTWTYDMGVLKIVFPLNSKPEVVTEAVDTQVPNTEDREREEVEETQTENMNHDADVGLERGDRDEDNEIPNSRRDPVEATTYAVDLKNEVELVPVRKEDNYDINNYVLRRRV